MNSELPDKISRHDLIQDDSHQNRNGNYLYLEQMYVNSISYWLSMYSLADWSHDYERDVAHGYQIHSLTSSFSIGY